MAMLRRLELGESEFVCLFRQVDGICFRGVSLSGGQKARFVYLFFVDAVWA
jgi:hypothetical protein